MPEVPIDGAGAVERDPGVVEVAVDVGHAGRDLAPRSAGRRGGAARGGGRTRCPSTPPAGRCPAPSTSSVEPAADVDDEHRLGRHRDLRGDRAGEDQRRLLVAGQHLRLDAEPTAYALGEDGGVARRRGSAEVAQKRTARAGRRGRGSSRRTRRSRRRCAPAPRRPARPVRSTPWPRRTTRESRRHVELPSSRTVADQELDRVGAAVDGGDGRLGVLIGQSGGCSTHGPRGPPVAEPVEHLVAERVDARAPWRATGRRGRGGT